MSEELEARIQGDIAEINPDYVELAARAIYESLFASRGPIEVVGVTAWPDLNADAKAYYRDAAIAAIKALLGAYYREEEAIQVQGMQKVEADHGSE